MGLDMYLRAVKYVSAYEFRPESERAKFNAVMSALGLDSSAASPQSPSATVHITVAYWRKANAIHNWFVTQVQDGKDECQRSYVDREQLVDLLEQCKKVLACKDDAEELLPTTSGFFFGSTEYDEGYWEDINLTISQLSKILGDEKFNDFDFEYQASW